MSLSNTQKNYKYVHVLLTLYITILLIVVVLANRFIIVFGMLEAGGIFVFPLTFLICDIVSEVYGYSLAKKFIWLGVFAELLFAIIGTLEMKLPYPQRWMYSQDYYIVFHPTIRYVFSGLIALLCGEFVNIYLISRWKVMLHGKYFILRSIAATSIGQMLLSIIVDFTAFFGNTLSLKNLIWMIFCGWLWKLLSALVLIYPTWVLIKFLKKSEDIDIYDVNTNFNPFEFD